MQSLYEVEVLASEPRTSLLSLKCTLPAVRVLGDLCNLRLALRGLGAQVVTWGFCAGVVLQAQLSGSGVKLLF